MGICSCSAKYILFLFNLICAIVGLVLLVLGVLTIKGLKFHGDMGMSTLNNVNIALIVIGVIVFLIAFFGCCGAVRESICMLNTYAVILSAICIIEIVLGVLIFVKKDSINDGISRGFDKVFDNYESNKEFIDEIQKDLQCCGTESPRSWSGAVPNSCCKDSKGKYPGCEIFPDGCQKKFQGLVKTKMNTLGIVAIVFAAVEVLAIIFGFCLASSIRRQSHRYA